MGRGANITGKISVNLPKWMYDTILEMEKDPKIGMNRSSIVEDFIRAGLRRKGIVSPIDEPENEEQVQPIQQKTAI